MPCPACTDGRTIVVESSWDTPYKTIRRARHCLDCSYQWTTLEVDLDQIERLCGAEIGDIPSIDQPMERKPPLSN